MKNAITFDRDHELHGTTIWAENLTPVAKNVIVFKDGSVTYVGNFGGEWAVNQTTTENMLAKITENEWSVTETHDFIEQTHELRAEVEN